MNQNQNSNQSQTIANPKTQQLNKTPQMNDRDFLNDLLTTEKYMTDGYNTFLNEASHEALISRCFTTLYGSTKPTKTYVQPYVPKRLV